MPNHYGDIDCIIAMASDRLAAEFGLAVFERQIANVGDVKELRRIAVRLHATCLHQQKLYEALIYKP